MRHARLSRAHLSYADLQSADLSDADLSHADLSRANLRQARLIGTSLRGTDLTKADLDETVFVDVDLSSVIGLETCVHYGPSAIDYGTLRKSGRLPLSFLRGVGLGTISLTTCLRY